MPSDPERAERRQTIPGPRSPTKTGAPSLGVDQEALSSEARYRVLLASILDPLITIDEHGTIRDVSASVERVFGYAPEELLGRNVNVLMPEPHRSRHDEYLATYRRTGVTNILNRTREFEVIRKDGSTIVCDLSVSRVDGADASSVLFLGTFRDVTERKASEAALRSSEQRFRAIFDGAYQYLGLLAPDGTILEINRTALDATGVALRAVVGTPFWEAPWWSASSDVRERIRLGVMEAAAGKFVRFEVELRGRDGAVSDVDFSLKPVMNERGEVELLIPEGRDITDLKRVQRAETTMLRTLASIGESAALLAHEIKNPIAAVNVALRAVAEQLGEDHREILADLVARMQRVQALMQRTLSFAKPLALRRTECGCDALLRSAVASLQQRIVQAGAAVDVRATPELRLVCDAGLIEEVVSNLVANAIEAKPQGAHIVVTAAPAGDRDVELVVEDDGPGIRDAFRASLFTPFASTKPKGTGLGLAICKKIIEEHGGSIRVETGSLGGARFAMRLPRTTQAST